MNTSAHVACIRGGNDDARAVRRTHIKSQNGV